MKSLFFFSFFKQALFVLNGRFFLHFTELLFFIIAIFFIGFIGIGINNRNLLLVLMSFELMLLSAILNFVCCSLFFFEPVGMVYGLITLALAACESAIGLALIILYFKSFQTIVIDDFFILRG